MVEVDRLRFMLVDDDPHFRSLFAHATELSGHDVMEFEGGEVALEELPKYRPDVIVTNWMKRKGLNEREFTRRVRASGWTGPIVVATASFQDFIQDDIREIESDGVDLVVEKPWGLTELRQLINRGVALVRTMKENPILQSP